MWTKAADGSTFTNVFGDPAKAGLYVQFVRRPPNNWSTAHHHGNDQFEWVMDGRMYIGTGSSVDKDKTVGMPKGSYIHDFANGSTTRGRRMRTSGFWLPAWDLRCQKERPRLFERLSRQRLRDARQPRRARHLERPKRAHAA